MEVENAKQEVKSSNQKNRKVFKFVLVIPKIQEEREKKNFFSK